MKLFLRYYNTIIILSKKIAQVKTTQLRDGSIYGRLVVAKDINVSGTTIQWQKQDKTQKGEKNGIMYYYKNTIHSKSTQLMAISVYTHEN